MSVFESLYGESNVVLKWNGRRGPFYGFARIWCENEG